MRLKTILLTYYPSIPCLARRALRRGRSRQARTLIIPLCGSLPLPPSDPSLPPSISPQAVLCDGPAIHNMGQQRALVATKVHLSSPSSVGVVRDAMRKVDFVGYNVQFDYMLNDMFDGLPWDLRAHTVCRYETSRKLRSFCVGPRGSYGW